MEIERKFLIPRLPENLASYPEQMLEQAYLCTVLWFGYGAATILIFSLTNPKDL